MLTRDRSARLRPLCQSLAHRHLSGPGGIRSLLAIAVPMIVSSATEMLMMLVDRGFLARLGREHIAAASSGGLMTFLLLTFFLGLIGYVNALVAQHLGAERPDRCAVAATQGLLVGLIGYPVVMALLPAGLFLLRAAGHDPVQQALERRYTIILVCGSAVTFLALPLRSFFTGIGRTRIVLAASTVAMLVNVIANYLLIFGKAGLPRLGIAGAAYGTVLGNLSGTAVLVAVYLGPHCARHYNTRGAFVFDRDLLKLLLRFGTPSGLEFFLNVAAFNVFVQLFHSYGKDVAAAVTITFNWDMAAFFPMIGLHLATMSLVGRHMGAGNVAVAERSAYSGMKLAAGYSGGMSLLFLTCPAMLVRAFAPEAAGIDYSQVVPLATAMLRLAALYVLSDAVAMVFGAALRGAGDTHWCMRTSVTLHWVMAVVSLVLIRGLRSPPLLVWCVFVFLVMVIGAVYLRRFRQGVWKTMRVLETGPPISTTPPPPAPAPDEIHA